LTKTEVKSGFSGKKAAGKRVKIDEGHRYKITSYHSAAEIKSR
jgi:Ser-tRNA(Ala) deacylase AlaX